MQADGRMAVEPTMDPEEVGAGGRAHGQPAALDQHPDHDHHGDQDAVRRPGVGPEYKLRSISVRLNASRLKAAAWRVRRAGFGQAMTEMGVLLFRKAA